MLKITSIAGNIFHENDFDCLVKSNFEYLKVTRTELEKNRMRRETDKGTDIGVMLEPGTVLHNGDILTDGQKTIVIKQLPEKVMAVKLRDNPSKSIELLVLVGHIIGNRHRPISIENEIIYFPIQSNSEFEVFQRLFADVIDKIEFSIEEKIFMPHSGANVHDHG